jgi:hypothetical protein
MQKGDITMMHNTTKETTRREEERTERTEAKKKLLKEKLYKARACGALTKEDEAELLRYAAGVVAGRGRHKE